MDKQPECTIGVYMVPGHQKNVFCTFSLDRASIGLLTLLPNINHSLKV